MRHIRKGCRCEVCPLRDRKKVYGIGPDDGGRILLIGEAPGREEDQAGEPFVGAAGRYLNWGLGSAGILRHRTHIINMILCQPPNNDLDSPEGREAWECCKEGFFNEVDGLIDKGIKVISTLGGKPTEALIKSSIKITKTRGSVFLYKDLPLIPTFHPSYLNRMSRDQGEKGKPFFKWVWIADLKKVKKISEEGWEPPKENFNLFPTIEDVERFVGEAVKEKKLIGVDIETTSIDPFRAEIVVIALSDSPTSGISIPFIGQYGVKYWFHNGDEDRVKQLINDLFLNAPLMFQNALFDVRILRRRGFCIPDENIAHDSMLLHHSISPELPHDLGFIVSLYGETPYWKEDFINKDRKITDMADVQLRTYNLRDAVVLHQILPGLLKDLKETGTEKIYQEESLPLIPPILQMMENGIKLDVKKLEAYGRKLRGNLRKMEVELRMLGNLPREFNFSSDDEMRYFLFGVEPNKFKGLEAKIAGKKKKDTKVYQELIELLKIKNDVKPIYLPTAYRGRTTATGKLTVNEQGLLSFQRTLNNRLDALSKLVTKKPEEEAAIKKLLDWIEKFRDRNEVEKLISTYSHFPTGPDGRVHTSFLIHGTATGRLSSRAPNLQNCPKENKEIRGCFIPEVGHVLLSADYTNLEVYVMAWESNDDVLKNILLSGKKLHDENVKILFGFEKDHPLFSLAKRAAKIFFFGGISYGGGDNEIYEKVILEAPGLGLSFAKFKEAREKYFQAHPKYREWSMKVKDKAIKERRSDTFTGRVRQLLGDERDIQKEALNTPIQSGAASVVNRSLIRIYKEMKKKKLKSKLLLQIHDELLFEVSNDEVDLMKELVKRNMEFPVDFRGEVVVFPTDMKVGENWGVLK